MVRNPMLWCAPVAALLAACSGGSDTSAADQSGNASAAKPTKKERPPHCFFKESELEKFTLSKDGDEWVVTGRAYRSDGRYKAFLKDPKIEGRTAILYPTIGVNDTGFSAESNTWDVEMRGPAEGIDVVEVRCGERLVERMPVPGSRGAEND